jgi:nucleotide-binding universal stress UspA family protein
MNIAISMAKSHGAHLTAAALETLTPENVNSSDETAAAMESERMAKSLLEDFRTKAGEAGLDFDAMTIPGDADISANKMAHHGRNVDLVILSQPNPDSRNYSRMLSFAEEVMLYSGRPVLFIPYIGANRIPFKRAMISYDGTPAATRAIHDAIPILKRTEDVTILIVESRKQLESKSDVQTEALSRHLQRHGIQTHVERVSPGSNLVPIVVQNEITKRDIDVLVIGGYGTPSLRQKIFGSVTRNLLESMLVPILMAH